mmetsp:Transcript_79663/g.223464  ORF Transcript_79663/g.223464 Transcript_79663/m.223464 type:complete len:363 (-) Transcript_79663:21-1109(-)
MPARSRVPVGWRKELSSNEIMGAVMQASGLAAEPCAPGGGGGGELCATGGSLAARRPVLETSSLGIMIPGSGEQKAKLLEKYSGYVGLEEWEAVKRSVARDVVPVVRGSISDYLGQERSQPPTASDRDGSAGFSLPSSYSTGPATASQPATDPSSAGGSGGATATGSAPAASSMGSRGDRASSTGGGEAASTSAPTGSSSSAPPELRAISGGVADEPSTRIAGRICVGAVSPRLGASMPRPMAHAPAPGEAPPYEGGYRMEETAFYDGEPIQKCQVRTVAANAVGPVDSWRRPMRGGPPRVQDRDQFRYASARQMRPAREQNDVSRRRLNELLKLPKNHLDASKQHPSRFFNLVPSQNLRIV